MGVTGAGQKCGASLASLRSSLSMSLISRPGRGRRGRAAAGRARRHRRGGGGRRSWGGLAASGGPCIDGVMNKNKTLNNE